MLVVSNASRGRVHGAHPSGTIETSPPGLHMDRDRSREAFSRSIEEELEALYRVALRLTRHPADAEDLVAEAVAKAWH